MPEHDRLPTSPDDVSERGLLEDWLSLQHSLQVHTFGIDPTRLEGEERSKYVLWNAFALLDEVHEVMGEVSWKPWASSEFFNRDQFVKELVDAMHFLANLLLVAGVTGDELWALYRTKVAINIDRQANGYTGLEKCVACGAAFDDSDCTIDACAKEERC